MIHILIILIYIAFISLGLPDSLLGSAWPSMYGGMGVPMSYAGIISMTIAGGTIISSLNGDRLTKKLGTGMVTAVSIAITALAMFGFSVSNSFWQLILWSIPYGIGAGSIDAALNNYVAVHFKSYHMSWLHCMWGLGTIIGPNVMGYALTHGTTWNNGYRTIAIIQAILTIIMLVSLPVWKRTANIHAEYKVTESDEESKRVLPLKEVIRIPGVKQGMAVFFCYCALEQTAILWGSSYMVLHNGISPEAAARYAGLFLIGITVGRGINGFLTMKLSDKNLIRIGQSLIAVGIIVMFLGWNDYVTLIGFVLIGLGCSPVYPCMIHSTPAYFGTHRSQAVIGVQMASSYVGTCLMPPLFGVIANYITVSLLPLYLVILLIIMIIMHEMLVRKKLPD